MTAHFLHRVEASFATDLDFFLRLTLSSSPANGCSCAVRDGEDGAHVESKSVSTRTYG